MYCPECGRYNEEKARFCRYCGARLAEYTGEPNGNTWQGQQNWQQNTEQQNAEQSVPAPAGHSKKKGKKIWITAAAVLILAAAAAAAVFLWILPQQKEKNYKAHVEAGDRYLEDMDYEKAEDSYLAAIEIEPKEPEPYLKLADIYETQNEPGKAVDILERGAENTESPEIQEKYSLYTYVQNVLIPEEGQAEEGEYTCGYITLPWEDSVQTVMDPVHSVKGILASRIRDFDNDGRDELLVLSLNNEAHEYEYTRVDQNEIVMRMYEVRDGEVALSSETSALCPVLGDRDAESTGIFLHENEGQIYICGSFRHHGYLLGDGVKIYSFVMTYDGEEFVKEAGTAETIEGSDFYEERQSAEEMADYLEEIGLAREAEQIRESCMRCFEFVDDVEMLVLITGENNLDTYPSDYWQTLDTEELGELVLTLKLTWSDTQDRTDRQETEESSREDSTDDGQDAEETAGSVQETYDYLLESGDYNNYTSDWMAAPESYSILDINQDQIPELMIHSAGDSGWSNTLLYAYDPDSQAVKMVQDIYHYADIQYSDEYKAITFSEVRSALMYGGQDYYTLDGAELTYEFSVGWESDGTHDGIGYYMYQNDTRTEISEAESDSYFSELTEIEKISL